MFPITDFCKKATGFLENGIGILIFQPSDTSPWQQCPFTMATVSLHHGNMISIPLHYRNSVPLHQSNMRSGPLLHGNMRGPGL